jgi:hypothetical protein
MLAMVKLLIYKPDVVFDRGHNIVDAMVLSKAHAILFIKEENGVSY